MVAKYVNSARTTPALPCHNQSYNNWYAHHDPNTQAPSTGLKFEVNKKQSQVFCIRLTVTLNRLLVISNLDLILLF